MNLRPARMHPIAGTAEAVETGALALRQLMPGW
jgi:hypothetical protein